jgi:hypothetical protein
MAVSGNNLFVDGHFVAGNAPRGGASQLIKVCG